MEKQMLDETENVYIEEVAVLSKFNGEPLPENETERIHIVNGEIVRRELIENGEVVSSEKVKEVD
jgi:hypothetical protein